MFHPVLRAMQLQHNTILITGGSSGIGLELAARLLKKENSVIICGRSTSKLDRAVAQYPGLIPYTCDISEADACNEMAGWLASHHPGLNVLINNAAITHAGSFMEDPEILAKAEAEVQTNLMAPMRLTKLLLPMIRQQPAPAVINVTTGLVYAPRATYPVYNATKAALHAFTQVLRLQLADSPVRIVEVLMPAVDTPWHNGNPPPIAIPVEAAVQKMIKGLASGRTEIRVGGARLLYALSRLAPGFALRKINNL